jgi:hypothetical protein
MRSKFPNISLAEQIVALSVLKGEMPSASSYVVYSGFIMQIVPQAPKLYALVCYSPPSAWSLKLI